MGRAPRTVRGVFLDHPGSLCEACLRKEPGMRGEMHVRDEIRALEESGFLQRLSGRCAECRKNETVWHRA